MFVSIKPLNTCSASGMSRPFATIMSAILLKAPLSPSGAPFPLLALKKFPEPASNVLLSSYVVKRRKLPCCLYCVRGPSLKKCSTDSCECCAWRKSSTGFRCCLLAETVLKHTGSGCPLTYNHGLPERRNCIYSCNYLRNQCESQPPHLNSSAQGKRLKLLDVKAKILHIAMEVFV